MWEKYIGILRETQFYGNLWYGKHTRVNTEIYIGCFFVAVVVVVVFSQDSHGVYVKIPDFSVDKTEKCILCIIF